MDLVFAPSEIETWPIERLHAYANNAKMHGPDQVAKIAASMAKFGWTVPCMVADDGELIAGHGRVLAATLLPTPSDAAALRKRSPELRPPPRLRRHIPRQRLQAQGRVPVQIPPETLRPNQH